MSIDLKCTGSFLGLARWAASRPGLQLVACRAARLRAAGLQPVPEAKVVKNRLHLDIEVDEIEAAVAEALRLGAARIGEVVTDELGSFQVMHDPEGNEFCFVCD
jgi:predicted enzyme related to lactoylglutathione lyase